MTDQQINSTEHNTEELNSNNEFLALKVLPMPPDGSCFFHCILTACSGKLFFEEVMRRYEAGAVHRYDKKENGEIDRVRTLRLLVAQSLTDEDFENYNIMAIAEDATPCGSLRELKNLVSFTNDYANMVIINALVRLFEKKLGIVILVNGEVSSDELWIGDFEYHIFLKLSGCHYDLYQFYNKQTNEVYPILVGLELMDYFGSFV